MYDSRYRIALVGHGQPMAVMTGGGYLSRVARGNRFGRLGVMKKLFPKKH
ncbi:hypothetical protein S101446_02177 [Komagataeibacter europaeus]|nr:hypothetical protein S101446_02177 [Komagataeibacter europaeus]